jgi:shikimate 5-dehydrogenase
VALGLVDRLTDEAQRIGAVNTIIFERRGDRLVGDNTDGRGFLAAIRGRTRLRGQTAVIIGAGGSARAVGTALAGAGCSRIVVANRTPARGERLASRLADLGGAPIASVPLASRGLRDMLADAALVVNTTPAGLAGHDAADRPAHDAAALPLRRPRVRRPPEPLSRARGEGPPPDARRQPHAPPPGCARVRGVDRPLGAAPRDGPRPPRRGTHVD